MMALSHHHTEGAGGGHAPDIKGMEVTIGEVFCRVPPREINKEIIILVYIGEHSIYMRNILTV